MIKVSIKMHRRVQKTPKCQRCLELGHWSYECTNPPAYVYRPTARAVYFNPELKKLPAFPLDDFPVPLKPQTSKAEGTKPAIKPRSRSRSVSSSDSDLIN